LKRAPVAVDACGLIGARHRVRRNSRRTPEVETGMLSIRVAELDPVGVTVEVLERMDRSTGEVPSGLHPERFDGGNGLPAEVCDAPYGLQELLRVEVSVRSRLLLIRQIRARRGSGQLRQSFAVALGAERLVARRVRVQVVVDDRHGGCVDDQLRDVAVSLRSGVDDARQRVRIELNGCVEQRTDYDQPRSYELRHFCVTCGTTVYDSILLIITSQSQ